MKTDNGALAVSLVLTSLLAAASSADAQQRETRPLEGFDAIEVGGGIDLFLRQGQGFVVEVEAEDDDAAEIVTEVRDRTLEIRRKSSFNFFSWDGDPGAVHVTLPALVSLTASGGSDVQNGRHVHERQLADRRVGWQRPRHRRVGEPRWKRRLRAARTCA